MDYNSWQVVLSRHAGFTNVLRCISFLSFDEIVPDDEHPESCRKPMIRPKQKSIVLIEDMVYKFSKLGHLVLDIFVGTPSTSKAFLLVRKHYRNFGFDKDV